MSQRLFVLGSTGSIGDNVLDVVARNPQTAVIHGLTAHRNIGKLYRQCLKFRPALAIVSEPHHAIELQANLQAAGLNTEVQCGAQALCAAACAADCDTVVAAIVGAAGLPPTLSAARAGKKILLANKEALVMSGTLFMEAAANSGATILPLDSEHNAIFQCLHGAQRASGDVQRLILTASGGPFRNRPLQTLDQVTPDEACAHPNWRMGRKISVDSATMMNKGLELIEARWLFDIPAERIETLIHPQSIVHSMVVYRDQSVLAQLGSPDMRIPIAHALAYPQRIDSGAEPLHLVKVATLTFEAPDLARFPCLALALEVIREGGAMSTVLNAANEVAVEAFLTHRIRFTDIARVVDEVLQKIPGAAVTSFDEVMDIDQHSRRIGNAVVQRVCRMPHSSPSLYAASSAAAVSFLQGGR
ncbi:1-deoxy-D-xylulose-5-phosphate reductoisomerase [Pseudomonas chlororaphis]|uniref:1-deoxy-D-xylulose 5-phosphate reductoisomerase n=1 Tax=Pseudomonas chlororaphis TaxID=587753 RepID=A0AAQ0ATT5_9PSED|nr:1-deoxy-D-xylulose-5-phosphate reductoisomerase [Pseudomonas chlororaphis]AUG41113.1 1-deoxy-D-xylulose-5-phosphate reductoisomerase [Pseudomonas chlororaphis]QNR50727.1 1-deoxy-D-xylulose-5-phosphate reductoisomerase [Pseudomonas chlororaphis]